jgi:hypothetical protein
MINKCVACNRPIHLQHAAINIGVTGVGIGSRQSECSTTDFSQRPTLTADNAGKRRDPIGH